MDGIVGAFNGMLTLLLAIATVIVVGVAGYFLMLHKGRMQGE